MPKPKLSKKADSDGDGNPKLEKRVQPDGRLRITSRAPQKRRLLAQTRLVGFMAVRKPRAEMTAVTDVRQPAMDKEQQSRCCRDEVRRGGSLRCRSCCRWRPLGTLSSARVDAYATAPDYT
ncbi:hypothetical protein PF005_g25576 [Phytophthora fragariae]|uniref:Uncharacterized protein n=1 Tax=Phytophthora fragariae TaxID=53985 RepID=A0A6A3F5N3_9STRA|nr:hypothetical protein PF003_g11255 [Phytophthora fragariae]KAE8937428.1 hypothetical protein PF009_g12649 [Phytophthora fragariae]KAE8960232.1 hypothetical protein PF011_g30164 [Phytophthora fragariae]KAE9073971.1 hypothetical protein PF007_g25599 [Phytophthora fragariae]KAE9102163.1 hypothetical protein PF006_g22494 [Phytophthora fragariae]